MGSEEKGEPTTSGSFQTKPPSHFSSLISHKVTHENCMHVWGEQQYWTFRDSEVVFHSIPLRLTAEQLPFSPSLQGRENTHKQCLKRDGLYLNCRRDD